MSKSKTSLSSRKAYAQLEEYLSRRRDCQPRLLAIFTGNPNRTPVGKTLLLGDKMRAEAGWVARKIRKLAGKGEAERGGRSALGQHLARVIARSGLLRAGERAGVAVSGGADSVALLLLMAEVAKELGLTICVMHFNHRLRRAAVGDEKFVATLAGKLGLEVFVGSADIGAIAERHKANVEDAGRRARYAFFARVAGEQRLDKIAVAHTADDQAETVLAHILRGCGITGLGGIHPRLGKVIRPVLGTRRAELRAYLTLRKQAWREDATNRDVRKTRARIRGRLIPALERDFQPQVVEHLAGLAVLARRDEAVLERMAVEWVTQKAEVEAGSVRIAIEELIPEWCRGAWVEDGIGVGVAAEDAATGMSGRVIRVMVRKMKAAGRRRNVPAASRGGELNSLHVGRVLEMARSGVSGMSQTLPGGLEVRRDRDELIFCWSAGDEPEAGAEDYEYRIDELQKNTAIGIPELGCVFRFTVIDWVGKRGETSLSGEVLNGDELSFPLTLRNWRHGDRFRAQGHTKPQKLKRLFNDKHINRWRRAGWPVLVSGGTIAWTREFGLAPEFKVNSETKSGVVISEEQMV